MTTESESIVLRYKVVGSFGEKVHEVLFPLNKDQNITDLFGKKHKIAIKMDDPLDYDSNDTFVIILEFNKNPESDSIESITLTQRYEETGYYGSVYESQSYWMSQYNESMRKLDELKTIMRYEKNEVEPISYQRIQKIDQRIRECKSWIDQINNGTCEVDYKDIVVTKHIVLPKSQFMRLCLDQSTRYHMSYNAVKVDFFWSDDQNEQCTFDEIFAPTNPTINQTDTTSHIKVVPRLNDREKRKHFRII